LNQKPSLSNLYLYATTKRLHNTPQHIHYDGNFPENFNAQGRSQRSLVVKVKTLLTINNWPCSDVTTTLQNTAIVSKRQFFFEINESWYYMLNLPALHWGQKPE